MSELLLIDFERNPGPSSNAAAEVGRAGEELAARFLERRGLRLVCANFKVPVGRNRRGAAVTGEIDIVALDGDVLCFVEVKTRRSDEFAAPIAAVDRRKQRQITRTARVYRRIFDLGRVSFRFDIVTVVLNEKKPEIRHFVNFWTEDKFRKRFWQDEAGRG